VLPDAVGHPGAESVGGERDRRRGRPLCRTSR
jgi:hypothetical protein